MTDIEKRLNHMEHVTMSNTYILLARNSSLNILDRLDFYSRAVMLNPVPYWFLEYGMLHPRSETKKEIFEKGLKEARENKHGLDEIKKRNLITSFLKYIDQT